ncbi:MAG: hypothetical protein F6K24_57170 [Okeania sp. SIO2D1]|nr:hypothetical protein [Okeania sp. SIO2D1]
MSNTPVNFWRYNRIHSRVPHGLIKCTAGPEVSEGVKTEPEKACGDGSSRGANQLV